MSLLYICAATVMINMTNEPWTDFDLRTKRRATYVCRTEYKGCLKRFIKKEDRHYQAICGE